MLTVKRHSKKNKLLWDRFVKASNNGTIFHLRRFLSYHPKNRFVDHSIEFYKKRTLFSVFPAAELNINGKNLLVSHPGSTVGSFVVPERISFSDSLVLVELLINYSIKNKLGGIRLTIPPVLYQNRASNYIDYALLRNGFKYLKREITSTLFIENDVKSNLSKFKPSHARAVRKAMESGVEIKISQDVKSFYDILQENLKIRHGVSPTHTVQEINDLINLFPNSINIFGAFYKGEMIAGVLNFVIKDDVVLAFYISHKEKSQELRPLNLLFYSILEWCVKEKIKVYDFGIFTVNGEPNMGLGRFKENFGASGMFRDTFQIIF
ncbi:MAG: GNAT family N-acetyltransferase [Candidatus Marinimicrobia bacterium]|nr:GNAT family N-acetyltransferase [Candidatus Neomarinimicrobiota bacterium]|tara:strand:+ start:433 stop:1398 length:966 start_codon:yes stop_codon:yes gene_type:complete